MSSRGILLSLLALSATSLSAVQLAANDPIQVIVGFRQSPDLELIERLGGYINITYRIIPAIAVKIPRSALTLLNFINEVVYVEPDVEVQIAGHALSPQTTPWGINRIGSPKAWKTANGTGVIVALLDTGVERSHEDLTDRVVWGIGVVGSVNSTAETDWTDNHGHGTFETGVIAAVDNAYGVVGASPKVSMYMIKVLKDNGRGDLSDIIEGIEWAWKGPDGIAPGQPGDTGDKADVINMSLSLSSDSQALHNAVDKAYSIGMVIAASSGNSGDGNASTDDVQFPARYSTVIAVGAIDQADKVWSKSSDGPDLELAAPGVGILSTYKGNTYATGTGTSPSASHVSGAVALVLAMNPKLTPDQVRYLLKMTADQPAVGGTVWPNVFYGHGIVRVDKVLRYAVWLKGNHLLGPPWSAPYDSPSADSALSDFKRVHSNLASFVAVAYQDTATSNTVSLDTSQDGALQSIISKARSQRLKTTLSLFVWVRDGTWRGDMDPSDPAPWFQSYRSAVNHYAQLANSAQVDLFIIGSELERLKGYISEWETTISNVRSLYTGMISYNTNWWYDSATYDAVKAATWMSKLDYVGISAFFELTSINNPTIDDLKLAWFGAGPNAARPFRNVVSDLQVLSDTFRKPILFTEIGYRSIDGANKQPWSWQGVSGSSSGFDQTEQSALYDSVFQVFKGESWFLGTIWWAWTTNPDGGPGDLGYSPRGKTASSTLASFVERFTPLEVYDLSISKVTIPRTVGFNQIEANPLQVVVTVNNQGTTTENAVVTLSLQNGPTLPGQTVSVGPGVSLNVTFAVSVRDLTLCNYTVVADVTPLLGEFDTGDNQLVDGAIEVRIPGDANGDQTVNILDLVLVSNAFGSRCGDSKYLATADFDNDCDVDSADRSTAEANFGKRRTC